MSNESSSKGSNSHSESSNSSPNQPFIASDNKELTDLTLFGSSAPIFSRTGTVRRASSGSKKEKESSINGDEPENVQSVSKSGRSSPELYTGQERYRKSLDSTYRLSLESISEYKAKSSFSTISLYPSRECSSMESSSSDYTDYAMRSSTEVKEDKTLLSPASSYLSWIESVNSEYFGSGATSADVPDVDSKVGEWNNFWLNYNSARGRHISSPYLSASNEEKTGDELSDAKSTCSTQREFTDKNSLEQVMLSLEEVSEAIKCSQRITEILQNAIRRNEFDDSKNDSYYSQALSQQNSVKDEINVQRERSFSYTVDTQDLQKQKQLLKPTPQSSSSSCINALLNTGVGDILKRVMTKRRDVLVSPSEDLPTTSRTSFSDWSSTK